MKRLFNRIFVTSTLVLAAGVAGLLVGVKLLLTPKRTSYTRALPAVTPAAPGKPESLKADRHFSIKRTRSEVGYVYWILEGYGQYKCFVLCDSWDEAVAQAKARLAGEEPAPESVLTLAAGADA
jgi:hypothetical protein